MFNGECVENDLGYVAKAKLRKATRGLRDNPEKGKPLGGKLRGCRSIHIEGENRLIYRYRKDLDQLEVIAIGRRKDDAAYDVATRRVTG